MSPAETILLGASIINALAATGSVWFAFRTVQVSRATLNEQQRIREVERDEQQRIRQFEREERRYEQQVAAPVREYLGTLLTDWSGALQQGLAELDALIAAKAGKAETAAFVRNLTFSLRETWRRASFNLVIGADAWNPSLSRELEDARDELDDVVAGLLNERMARSLSGRPKVPHSLTLDIRKHSQSVMDCVARYAPRIEDASGSFAATGNATRHLGPGTVPARRTQR